VKASTNCGQSSWVVDNLGAAGAVGRIIAFISGPRDNHDRK
jgi:hypothetical protein